MPVTPLLRKLRRQEFKTSIDYTVKLHLKKSVGGAQQHMPITPGPTRQEDQEFKASLGYVRHVGG